MRNLWLRVHSRPRLVFALRALDIISVAAAVVSFVLGAYITLSASALLFVRYLAVLFVPFLLVGILRRIINAPRPCELYDFLPATRRGAAFPSRHVFSALAIGTLMLFIFPPLGIMTLVFGVLLGACRVFLGIHFPRDVIAGGLIGVISSLVGALIL